MINEWNNNDMIHEIWIDACIGDKEVRMFYQVLKTSSTLTILNLNVKNGINCGNKTKYVYIWCSLAMMNDMNR